MADLNKLYGYQEQALLPRLVPTYWPYAPMRAPIFQVYECHAYRHMGVTTLDTFVAPPPVIDNGYYAQKSLSYNGTTFYGNAPTSGVYTGVQEE